MHKCVICDRRPANDGDGYCTNCRAKIVADRRRRTNGKPEKYLTYRGYVVGLFRNGNSKLEGKLLNRKADKLPKTKTINLDIYCPGYTRDKVKEFKRAVLRLASGG